MKRVLLTGAGGFVGRRCLPELLARGYEVHAVGRGGGRAAGEGSQALHWHAADLLDRAKVAALLSEVGPTHLLHLAWYTEHGKFWSAVENLSWVGASLSLFESFAAAGGRRVVAAGTCVEYAPVEGTPCDEHFTPVAPQTLYGACKHATRTVLEAFARQAGLSHAWGRLFFPYGPGEPPGRLDPSVARALLAGEPALCTHGRQVRDFLHVEDAASAFVALLDSGVEGAVNVASGQPVTLAEVVERVAARAGRPDLVRLGARPAPEGEPPTLYADARRLRGEVGWAPRHDLDEGLAETVEWLRESMNDEL
ncbi:MAG TPA: NAD(P)-dependent oxidoreductase [Pyrinomonadaceae bacterium]